MPETRRQYIIAGGGIAGLTLACLLARSGRRVTVIEKSEYPRHKVCGEYVSNEVLPFLASENLMPADTNLPQMDSFALSDTRGNMVEIPLDLGGFGISRYLLDNHLCLKAQQAGAEVIFREKIVQIEFRDQLFTVRTNKNSYTAPWVIGAFGKRSELDRILDRPFMKNRSPYLGVKYHVKNSGYSRNVVSLHNFNGGYFGVNAVENDVINFCYLAHRDALKNRDSLVEPDLLMQNPRIRDLLDSSTFLWDRPEVINEISFETKNPVESHVLMCGDAAGMITPLCGNGMAIAFHTARLLGDILLSKSADDVSERVTIETLYHKHWHRHFSARLKTGRYVQRLFGKGQLSRFAVSLGLNAPPLARWIMSRTHGSPFN